jgi:tetratricopeptide (TPR) repeat protein
VSVVHEIDHEDEVEVTVSAGDRPGLRFDPGGDEASDREQLFRTLVPEAMTHPDAMQHLLDARKHQRAGNLEATALSMLRVAELHEGAENLEAAARVFRALEHLVPLGPAQLVLWFENANRRGDRPEAARIACQMGERAIQGAEPAFARDWFERAASLDPACQLALDRLHELANTLSAGIHSAPISRPSADGSKLGVVYGVGEVQIPLNEIVDRFQAGIQELVSDDAESQYALGMSFLAMGLPEQAVEALRVACASPTLRGRASELIGRCFMDLGRFEDAAAEFRTTVSDDTLDPATIVGVRFELGLALEAAGRVDEALVEFERVHQDHPGYPDAATKIRSLRVSLENH